MKHPAELLFLTTLLLPASTAPTDTLHRRSASFLSLRGLTSLEYDHSNSEYFSHPTKFFHESTFSGHYDGRFASAELPHHTRLYHLRLMLKAYTDAMARIGIQTWLMHGCLLGWWWNARIMPWDTDVDFMVNEFGIKELGSWWNMSVHHFSANDLGLLDTSPGLDDGYKLADDQGLSIKKLQDEVINLGGKKYLLEINPNYANTSTKDKENIIDARWIDTATGLFIDITTLHIQPVVISPYDANSSEGEEGTNDQSELYTKDQHAYSSSQMFPLRTSTFEGVAVQVPFDYEDLLLDEYGRKAITERWFRGWKFDQETHEWVMDGAEEFEQKGPYKGKGREAEYMVLAGQKSLNQDAFSGS